VALSLEYYNTVMSRVVNMFDGDALEAAIKSGIDTRAQAINRGG